MIASTNTNEITNTIKKNNTNNNPIHHQHSSSNTIHPTTNEDDFYYKTEKYFMVSQGSAEIFSDHPAAGLNISSIKQIHTLGNDKILLTHSFGNLHYCIIYMREKMKKLHFHHHHNHNNNNQQYLQQEEIIMIEEEPRETTASLFRQLCLIHDLTCFSIRIQVSSNFNRGINQNEAKRVLKPVVETLKRLYKTQQSILVQGIEYVDLNYHNRQIIIDALKDGIEPYPFLLHAVLLVGTKLAAVYSRKKTWVLLPRDILCLMIYSQSTFFYKTKSTTDGGNNNNSNVKKKKNHVNSNTSGGSGNNNVNSYGEGEYSPSLGMMGSSDQFIDHQMMNKCSTSSSDDNISDTDTTKKEEEENIESKFDYLFFHATENHGNFNQKLFKCGVYFEYDKEQDMTLMLICDPTIVNIEQLVKTNTTNTIGTSLTVGGGGTGLSVGNSLMESHSLGNHNNITTTGTSFDETEGDIEEEEEDKETVRDQLQEAAIQVNEKISSFKKFSYLKVKADSHMTMLNYLHYCPGLIHFILVDRIYDRVYAPRIVSLHTNNISAKAEEEQISILKKKVWEMCYVLQQYRDEGYTEIGVCGDGVQYWFKEWFEDENQLELKMTRNNLNHAKAHYELYTMYLPFVSTQA
ncbi:hypothetical protein ABK040_012658, partial [Willaertia magna]